MKTPEIMTDRLILGALRKADAPQLFEYRSEPEVLRYQSWAPGSLEEAMDFVTGFLRIPFDQAETWYQLAIRHRQSGSLIGDFGLHFLEAESRQVEIGFTIAPTHQRNGYGTEAVTAILGYLFDHLDKHRVIASVDPRNEPSVGLLKRLGMRQEAHFRQSIWFQGEWADDMVFALLKSEWSAAREREGQAPERR
ncbi:MAG: GNAT family N-acetyltransferase [Deltaproteobacteria bacterium]|nr:GNAT family N-acetyltransferase [Deltaproteobacteria bacterium]